jgi:translocation and assembly module TamB
VITRRTLIIVIAGLLLALGAPALGLYWLCYTEPGLQWIGARVTRIGKVRMQIDGLQGRLTGPLSATRFELDHERMHIVAHDVSANVKLRSVLAQTIHVDFLALKDVAIKIRPRTGPSGKRAPRFMPRWLRVQADSVSIDALRLELQSGRTLTGSQVHVAATVTGDALNLRHAAFVSERLALEGSGRMFAEEPLRMKAEVDWKVSMAEQPRWAGRISVDGDLERLDFTGNVVEPVVADVSGALSELKRDWHWDANAKLEEFTLQPWSPGSRLGLRSAVLSGSGHRDGFKLSASIEPLQPATGPLDIAFAGNYAQRTLHADELRVAPKSGRGSLHASGSAGFAGGATTLELRGRWRDLDWPLVAPPSVHSSQGEFTLSGQLPYRYSVQGEIAIRESPALSLTSAGYIDRGVLRVETLVARDAGAELQASGDLNWANDNAWTLDAKIRGFDPARFDARFPGQLTADIAATGVGFERDAPWSADLRSLRGTLRSQPVRALARVSHADGRYSIAHADLRFGAAHLEASGQYGERHDIRWDLAVPDASDLLPEASGSLHSQGTFSGSKADPHLVGSLDARELAFAGYRLGMLRADAELDPSDRRESHLKVSGTDLLLHGRHVKSTQVTLDGRASAHQFSFLLEADDSRISLETQSSYTAKVWRGTVRKLDARLARSMLSLTAPAAYAIGRELAQLEQLCLTGAAERACARGNWRPGGPWDLALDVTGVPLVVLGASATRDSQYTGVVSLQADLSQAPGQPWVGRATGIFADGMFQYRRANGQLQRVQIGSGQATLDATPARFQGVARIDAGEDAMLDARANADRTAAADWRDLPLTGSLHTETRELGFVPRFVPEVDRAAGKLQADLQLAGTVARPEVSGSLVLSEGELDLYAVNMQLREIALRADLAGNALKLVAGLRAGSGSAELAGDLEWRDRQPFGRLKFKGENLELVNVPEARILVSPDLRFRIDGRSIGVDGAVRIPSAFITPADLSGAVLPSSDETIVGTPSDEEEDGFEVTTGVQLVLGQDVRVDSFGLKARIEGNIAAYAAPGEVSTATGELRIAEGKYSAYTRELDIEHGRLIFSGGPTSDPGVDLRASKEFPEALVGVNVRGTLRNPRLSFWSEPSLPQTQIASLIVAGGEIGGMNGLTGSGTQERRDQLLAQGSAIIASQLSQQLGLDLEEVRLESDTSDQTRLVLGRYLSPRFYVSYGISLTEAINTLKLRYTFNDRWTIRSEAGENRSADLEYKIER